MNRKNFLKGKEIVPVRGLPSINGQMIGFTGSHGGGKTVTSETIVECIFLAQSGLPVFGKGFRLNPKELLGIVFIERGEGSTAQLLLQKSVNILKAIRQTDSSKIVLIFDELGTGTQEAAGLKLGQDLLRSLAGRNISVIFSTHITALAEFAQEELGVECLQFTKDHRILPGIGTGEMEVLRKDTGFDQLLS